MANENVQNDILQMEFEGLEAQDSDVPSMTKLLNQLVKESGVSAELLARVLVSQNYVGSVLKPVVEDIDFDDEDPEDQPVFAITSMINLSARDEIPVLQFQEFLRECLTCQPVLEVKKEPWCFDVFKTQYGLSKVDFQVGMLVKERMVNLPFQYLLPSLESLMADLAKAKEMEMPYTTRKMIHWSKMYIENGEYIHCDMEDAWFDENSYGYFDYPLKKADTVMVEEGKEDTGAKQIRRVYIFNSSKLSSFVLYVKELTEGF